MIKTRLFSIIWLCINKKQCIDILIILFFAMMSFLFLFLFLFYFMLTYIVIKLEHLK